MKLLLIDPSRIGEFRLFDELKQSGQRPTMYNPGNAFAQHRPSTMAKTESFTKHEGRDFRNEVRISDSSLGIMMQDGTCIIPITESLDYKPSIWSYYGYCTSLQEVGYCFDAAMQNSKVSRIIFAIDSPGGVYTGTPELGNKIYEARSSKQIIAVADPCAASGAIWLGSCASKFYCLASGSVGSIGCLMVHSDYSKMFASEGIINTIIRDPERKAEFNYMEPLTEAALKDCQDCVSNIATEFQTAIARNRKTTLKNVQENFGSGSMMDARKALAVGMIDGLVTSLDEVIGAQGGGSKTASTKRLNPQIALAVAKRTQS